MYNSGSARDKPPTAEAVTEDESEGDELKAEVCSSNLNLTLFKLSLHLITGQSVLTRAMILLDQF